MATQAFWPQLGHTVTLSDGITIIDEDGALLERTDEVLDLQRLGQLLDYDPRLEPHSEPDEPPTGHAAEHLLGGDQEIDGDKLAIHDLPTYYLPVPVPPYSTDPMHLGAHLNGIGTTLHAIETTASSAQSVATAAQSTATAAQSAASTAQSTADAALAAANAAAGGKVALFTFFHLGQSPAQNTTRRMFPGYSDLRWSSGLAWRPRHAVPAAGTLRSMTVQHSTAVSGGANTVTYVLWKSSNGSTTWSATALTVAVLGSQNVPQKVSANVPVAAGDLIGIEVSFSAGVDQSGGDSSMIATVEYEKA